MFHIYKSNLKTETENQLNYELEHSHILTRMFFRFLTISFHL